eukprot:comp33529_c0_seq1/m.47283 comp33529_c0_seq1/g.47283  ORF comp33529_c0_seq1/g.47283 comp33529_c0_seq1/m.47283 type:complete len:218 (-) comp33529_c0_seq1:428-1081(-)
MISQIFAVAACSAALVSAATTCPDCCNTKALFMCNELGGVGGLHGAVCCANGQWGCPSAGAAGPSGCPPGVGYKKDCPVPAPTAGKSFMVAKFEDATTYPHTVLLGRGDSAEVATDGSRYTPFVWSGGKLQNFYDSARCLGLDGDYVMQVACTTAPVWETIAVTPAQNWTKKGNVPVVNWSTGTGANKKCVTLDGKTAKVTKCDGKDMKQKWFLLPH